MVEKLKCFHGDFLNTESLNMHHSKKFNNYEIIYDPSGAYALVELTQCQWTMIYIEDWEQLKQYKWYALWHDGCHSFYACSGASPRIFMHRLVLGLTDSKTYVDHANHDTLDNRRTVNGTTQLRIATPSQNQFNGRKRSNNRSGHIGVSKHESSGKTYWRSRCKAYNKKVSKIFPYTPEGLQQASEWRQSKAEELHGEFVYKGE